MNFRIKPYLTKLLSQFAASEKWQRLVFALLFTLLIISFVKIPIERYTIEWQQGQMIEPTAKGLFLADDLDLDGNSERIYLYRMLDSDRFIILIYDNSGFILNSISMVNHEWSTFSIPGFYDINNDGTKEIVVISHRNDSVLLNAIHPFSREFIIPDFFLGNIERPQPQMAQSARFFAFDDYNCDGQKELYFNVDAGYGLKPRGLFRMDVDSMKLYKTPESYIVWDFLYFQDTNSDGIPEIFPFNYAPMNVHFETPYPDTKTWLTLFDLELNYLFDPIQMYEGYGNLYTMPVRGIDTLLYALCLQTNTEVGYNELLLATTGGEIVKRKKFFKGEPSLYMQKLAHIDGKDYLIINNLGRYELTPELNNLPHSKPKKQRNYKPWWSENHWLVDADDDGHPELFYYNERQSSIEIVNNNKKATTRINLPSERQYISGIYPYLSGGQTVRLMVSGNLGFFFLEYSRNPYFWTKFVIWLAIFSVSWIFIFIIQLLQRRRMEQNWETEKHLTELQFSTIRSQLNPHFIFNALNSIGYLIENGKKDEAYDFLSVNSRMIRHILEDAEMTTQSLNKEIEFVRDYLSVQKFRFGDKLEYTFDVDPLIELTLVVPKMIIHTYVENAVKHGLKNHKGKICIKCEKIPHGLKLMISDNGIGITHAENSPQNTGKGLSIMDKYYRLFEKEFNCKIHTTIDEIKEVGNSGTEVVITIEYLS